MRITLNDNYKVSDNTSFAKGVVCLREKNGKIIFKKENMIVLSGREWLKNNGATGFYCMRFGSKGDMTTPDMTSLKGNITAECNYINLPTGTTINDKTENCLISEDENTTTIHFIAKVVSGNTTETSRELGLFVNNGETLFSRVVFEPVAIGTNNSEYIVDYYIYF